MIKPTVGRKVWIRNRPETKDIKQPEDATIVYVHTETCINVGGRNANGEPFVLASLRLYQGEGDVPEGVYAEWMPYQQGQARKQADEDKIAAQEQVEDKIAAQEQVEDKIAAQEQVDEDKIAAQEQVDEDKIAAQEQVAAGAEQEALRL